MHEKAENLLADNQKEFILEFMEKHDHYDAVADSYSDNQDFIDFCEKKWREQNEDLKAQSGIDATRREIEEHGG